MGQLASGVAHDLNNSLSPVLGYSDLLLNDVALPERAREWLGMIRTGARDAALVVDRLRQFYRRKDHATLRETVDLKRLFGQIPELTRPKWRDEAEKTGREIDIVLELQDVEKINGSESELRQVLTNLVLNAVDAMPAGGRITLRLSSTADSVVAEVADTGIGMTDEQRRHCFEPFFTTKPEGSGLGLSVCHGIVLRHGGHLDIDTHPGQGTTIRVVLPKPTARCDEASQNTQDATTLPQRRVLYIDDDARVRGAVAAILKQLEQQVDVAEDGVTGLAMLRATPYDVVITDLGMSGMDGRAVTRMVKQYRPETPVIMLTGWFRTTALEGADESELPDTFVQKPVTLDKLRRGLLQVVQPSD